MNTNTARALTSAPPIAAPPPHVNRMKLDAVTRGIMARPWRLVIHGTDGVGKSTFAADAPAPIFLGPEDGSSHLDVARFPAPRSFADVRDALATLTHDPHDFGTLAIDSLDWLEPLVWRYVCDAARAASIEEVGGGYGKGYTAALDAWRVLLGDLERLQAARRTNVVLIAHSFIKPFKNPEGEDFDRYIIKLHEKSAALIREWSDAVYFANYEMFAAKDERTKRVRGISTGARLLHTQRTAAFDAKDRYGLPEAIALSWSEFESAAKRGQPVEPEALIARIKESAATLGGEIEEFALSWIERHANNVTELSKLNNRLNEKLAAKREQEGGK